MIYSSVAKRTNDLKMTFGKKYRGNCRDQNDFI